MLDISKLGPAIADVKADVDAVKADVDKNATDVAAALDQLVLSCLAKDPAERPQSARELSRRLAEVDGASAWTQDRAREWWATHQPAQP